MRRLLSLIALTLLALGYWEAVRMRSGVSEPWDAAGYWTIAYPGSLVMALVAGRLLPGHAVFVGLVITFAQLPVMLLHAEAGALLPVGMLMLGALSLPAMAAATLGGRLRRSAQPR